MMAPDPNGLRNSLKDKLARGEVASCLTVRLVASSEIVLIAQTAGFDSIYIDLEHSSLSIEAAAGISVTALAAGLPCLIRVPANTPDHISRVLDGGALGVIAPDIRSADEARAVVEAARYPALGKRGVAAALPHLAFRSPPARESFAVLNAATMVIVQCESQEAVENAEAIAAVEGVDMLLTGTNDLLADMGLVGEFDHPAVRAAHQRIIAACRKHGKHAGIGGLTSRPALMAEFVRMGARYVSAGTDLSLLLAAAKERASMVKDLAANA